MTTEKLKPCPFCEQRFASIALVQSHLERVHNRFFSGFARDGSLTFSDLDVRYQRADAKGD